MSAVDDEIYRAISLECLRCVLGATNLMEVAAQGAVGWGTLVADVFDMADLMAAELEKRLAVRNKTVTPPAG
jgi:hypothetical protein